MTDPKPTSHPHEVEAKRRARLAEADHEVTRLLDALPEGDPAVADRLARLIYDELRVIATAALRREAPGHTLQPTELVHEAFLRLLGQRDVAWQGRAHFCGIAAQAIRRILIDHARRRRATKRDHGIRVTLDEGIGHAPEHDLDLIALDTALERLATLEPRQARVVELRYFGGLSVEETADLLDISRATVKRDWTFARAFLLREIKGRGSSPA